MHIISRREAARFALMAPFAIAASTQASQAYSAARIDAGVHDTLREFNYRIWGARELLAKASAILVFPSVIKAGMGIGGEYGEGALLVRGGTVGYYNTISASVGFQLGAQARSASFS